MASRKKTAIIGAGRGGTAFLQMLSDYKNLEIVGITDINLKASGIQLARRLGIPVYQNYSDIMQIKDIELILNLTGDFSVDTFIKESIKKSGIREKRKKDLEILSGTSAKLVWEIVNNIKQKEDEKTKLAEKMLVLNKDLNEVKEYLENIMENSFDMIITTDLNKAIVSFNRGSESLLGYKREEVIGKSINFLWKDKYEREKLLEQLNQYKYISNYETELVKKNNQTIQVSLTLSYLKNQAGEIIGTVGISKDISEKKKMEKELLRSNQELEDFVYTISHDLQAPLRAIYGFSDILIDEYEKTLDNNAVHYLERIKKGAERMKLLIDDLLDLSRIGRQEHTFVKVDILEMLITAKNLFLFDLKTKKGEIKLTADFPSICCNKTGIQQVFTNLIFNAIKFNENNPIVEIGYSECKDAHRFFVKDNGIGIKPEFHRKIFNIFQRLNHSLEYEGTGIGLTIVKKIIELHHGKIWLESVPKQGTIFYFTIAKDINRI